MNPTPRSFVIQFLNGNYNRGCGFEVANITAATLYDTREKANLVASPLQGSTTVHALPVKADNRPVRVGPRWITSQHPRPTTGQIATLRVVLNTLRDEAVLAHKLEGEARNPDTREGFAHERFAKEAHSDVVLDVLKYLGADNLPAPLNLPNHPVLK